METPFPIEIEPRAAQELKRLRDRKCADGIVRVGVKGGGCSGLEYVLRIDQETRDGDLSTEVEGLKFVCDPRSAEFLAGARLVYNGNLMSGGVAFENPNAARSCGCGTSFTPKA